MRVKKLRKIANSLKERMTPKTHNKNVITRPNFDLVNEMSDTDSSVTTGEDDDSVGWRSLPKIIESSDEGDTCDSDST